MQKVIGLIKDTYEQCIYKDFLECLDPSLSKWKYCYRNQQSIILEDNLNFGVNSVCILLQ